jgi:signal transduction histidine kinase
VQKLETLIRRSWPWVRRYIVDALIVVAAIEAAIEVAVGNGDKVGPTISPWFGSPLVVAITLPLLLRRRFPFGAPTAVMAIGATVSFIDGSLVTYALGTFLTVLAVSFSFGLLPDRRQGLIGYAIAIATAAIVVHNDPDQSWPDFIFISLLFAIVWLAGYGLGGKLAEAREAKEKAARLEQEREEQARIAVADERARIARELHDVVGHAVSVMTVQASGVRRLLRPEQEREREALLIVEQTGRQALAEMRRLVGVLRRPEEGPALAPQPSLEHLDKLVAQVREAGLPVALRVEGTPSEVPRGIDLTAYRLVQEGLTNALKHADADRADVLVRYGDGEIELVVSDDGRGNPGSDGGGHGLVGMRERVSVYGGELEAGPRAEGGFELRARLPLA